MKGGRTMIKLDLKVEEVQLVLNALSQLPFAQVAPLIELVKTQAEAQLKAKEEPTDTTKQ
jgi:hypothetical protein